MTGARRHLPLVVASAALALLAGCARAVMTPPSVPAVAGMEEVGMASWYGAPHHGRRTSSGEVFDMHQLTAAHRTLPFGTRLLVTNRDTSQSAEVRVNDRGPFVAGRILDVSYAAARLLGAVGPGIIPVRVRVLSLPPRSSNGDGPYTIQIGSFTTRARAEALRDTMPGATIAETTVAGETVYRVRVGAYPDRTRAGAAARDLTTRGYQALVVEQ
ncbi:MAG TPA: septal ring lytic transglycosylase RlpA family protein [Methylomirabilota bacterium]|nr:septal ring lytic transglycosylase RlpA family protein [Methylomirabilota bacterium]